MNQDLRKLKKTGKSKRENGKSLQSSAGFSLMEMLVVVFVFSILGVVATQILALSLRGSGKSESIGETRANIEYAVSNMERLLRNATEIDSSCGVAGTNILMYTDENGEPGEFECDTGGNYIASGSASIPITSDAVEIDCNGSVFICPAPATNVPQTVLIEVTGQDAQLGTGVEGSSVTVKTQVQLRNYKSY
jgi:prepilin-type N-terminal cleavage/methylation domain-containing protein